MTKSILEGLADELDRVICTNEDKLSLRSRKAIHDAALILRHMQQAIGAPLRADIAENDRIERMMGRHTP